MIVCVCVLHFMQKMQHGDNKDVVVSDPEEEAERKGSKERKGGTTE